jgi:O-methyltransferase
MKKIAKRVLPDRIVRALRILKGDDVESPSELTYDQDGLSTQHNCDFMFEDAFVNAYSAGEKLDSWFGGKVHWRVHVLFWAATRALELEGDLVECGVHRGGFSKAVAEYLDFGKLVDRRFYLLDSFEGMSADQLTGEEIENQLLDYPYASDFEAVTEAFRTYPNVVIVKGRIPESLSEVAAERVSFLSIDLNNAAPEIAAAKFFWDKLVSGAAMILDDYGWKKHIVQKRAFDEFAKHRGVPILSLPTGQGLILKP